MNKVEFDKGTKRKCASCNTLFYDLNKNPIICPSCGADVSLLTNVSKRGRPPKATKQDRKEKVVNDDIEIEQIDSEDDELIADETIDEDENVESIIEIDKDREDSS